MDNIEEDLTRQAIRQALERHRYYFETVEVGDDSRAEQLGRLGRALADDLGLEVSMAVKPRRRDAGIQICITAVQPQFTVEPA